MNVIVADKQEHPQFLTMVQAVLLLLHMVLQRVELCLLCCQG